MVGRSPKIRTNYISNVSKYGNLTKCCNLKLTRIKVTCFTVTFIITVYNATEQQEYMTRMITSNALENNSRAF